MYKFLACFFLFFISSFALDVKIVATVGSHIVTSYDLQNKIKLTKMIDPNFDIKRQQDALLERLIQEKLLFNMADENGFVLTPKEIQDAVNEYIKSQPRLKTLSKNSALYKTLENQIKGEIIFSVILRSNIQDKIEFSQDEIIRFKNAYNSQNDKKINNKQSEEMLTSMKLNEAQAELLKSLQENTLIEKK